jgi:hypothetical protein
MSEDKIQEVLDKIKRGEIGPDMIEVGTGVTDEGGISSTVRRICGPCNIKKHDECIGAPMCNCNHPSHHQHQHSQTQ